MRFLIRWLINAVALLTCNLKARHKPLVKLVLVITPTVISHGQRTTVTLKLTLTPRPIKPSKHKHR